MLHMYATLVVMMKLVFTIVVLGMLVYIKTIQKALNRNVVFDLPSFSFIVGIIYDDANQKNKFIMLTEQHLIVASCVFLNSFI